ncbi:HTTM domain-containing protein [Arenibacter sp. GZD96]|uniref:HTTM domain-containing protein n=1 Tax=Aurantibrevibacter litoralis TaxID=3106030 RepID=UPI002B015F5A|nr:HTTM domain-containing protein [Arenibacter sp. GZD-96]MEA1786500.1 HTTM domain-containing protein [Arenibacter sp. GZD-96]
MLNRLLFTKMDNAPLVIFRVFFGILVSLECYGAILTGWVKRILIDPQFTFTFIGFEWLQPLPGNGMYFYFFLMGSLGVCMALGYKYRLSAIAFLLLWSGVYFMQKSAYNNHYYLLVLIAGFMALFPAHKSCSIDARQRPSIRSEAMYSYVKWIVVAQLLIVYTYASIAKLYADWLDFGIIRILMQNKAHYVLIGDLLQEPWVHKTIGVFGILFDLLIVPALLWKPTRKIAFSISIFFHVFNSLVFQIGIFPYLSLAFSVFFFEPEIIRNIFLKRKKSYTLNKVIVPGYKNVLLTCLGLYFVIQIGLPLRHHFFTDHVLWTEEGHRLSWRMMLRSRAGDTRFYVVDKNTETQTLVHLKDYLTEKQIARLSSYPDFMWQFAQYLKKEYRKVGQEVAVYVVSDVSINGKPARTFIDPKVDLASVPWHHFKHNDWILPSEKMELQKSQQ